MATLREIISHNAKIFKAQSELESQIVELPSFCVGATKEHTQQIVCWFSITDSSESAPSEVYLNFKSVALKESEFREFVCWLVETLGLRQTLAELA